MSEQIYRLSLACGGDSALAKQLHVTPRSVVGYRSARFRPSKTVCRSLARVAEILDGPSSPRARAIWWLLLDREGA